MIERGNPLLKQEHAKHVHLTTARASTLNIKQPMLDRGTPLSAVTQITSQELSKHVPLMKARTSTLETKQIMIERNNPLSAVMQATGLVTSDQ